MNKIIIQYSFLALFALLPAVVTADQKPSTSFQGFSGLVNTPTAELFDPGQFNFLYSNQTETRGGYRNGDNYHFGIGLWQHLEISGRLADYNLGEQYGLTDLSANIKLGIPYIPKDWFNLAVGIQDVGGAADNFDAKYVVASKTLFEKFNFSFGVGQSESNLSRLDGVFGGVSWQATQWATISLEYDAADTNLGLTLSSPEYWFNNGVQLTASALVYSSNEALRDEVYYGIGLKIPLGETRSNSNQRAKVSNLKRYPNQNQSNINSDSADSLAQVKKRLVKEGFESIKLGQTTENTVYIELENHIYNRNQLDGIGVALGIISKNLSNDYSNFKIVFKEREIPIFVITGSTADYLAFINYEKSLNIKISTDTYAVQQGVQLTSLENANDSWLKPRFTFWPSLVSRVGTEYGAFDVSVALASHLELPLWQGGALSALHISQLAETEDFKDGRHFADDKQKSGLQEVSLHQTFALPFNVKNMTFLGRYRDSYNYLANEIRWQNNDGTHRVNLLTAKYENQSVPERKPYFGCNILFSGCWPDKEPQEREVVVGMYRYYSADYDASIELRVGQFWQQDKGVVVQMERMFGDVTVNLTYKNTKVTDQEENQFIGLGFSIPLTPRKDHINRFVQVRGKPKWNYSVNTLIGKKANTLTPGTADSAQLFYNLDNSYANYDRLGEAYIYKNANRLKDAFELISN